MDNRKSLRWSALLLVALAGPATAARPLDPAPPSADDDAFQYMRAAEDPSRSISLEIASRILEPGGPGPTVALVGVSHIGEHELYQRVQDLLDQYDVVLYESVKPAGTGGAGGKDDAERAESTRAAMEFLATVIEAHRLRLQRYPGDLAELGEFASALDPRMSEWVTVAATDGWGAPIGYDATPDGTGFELLSLGADRKRGGEGPDADLSVTNGSESSAALLADQEDNLQGELAKALGLEFQLDALDYGRDHFRCSDMSMDQLERAFRRQGLDFGPIGGSLAGSSLPGRLAVGLLRVGRILDVFLDGAIADAMKIMLIELFNDQRVLEMSLQQFGPGFAKVIIEQRNQVVVDQLKSIVAREPEVKSVAILYGAAHMPDMAGRLGDQLGYRPAGEQWFTALEVDLAHSPISESQLQTIRGIVRQQLRLAGP